MRKKTAIIVGAAGLLASATLSGCVTNVEPALPEGWSAPNVDEVPEIAAMYEDADGVLTVGTNPPFAPFEFKDSDGSIIGLEMDLANAVAQVLGLEFQPVEQDFSMILPAVQAGQIDLGGSGFTDTDERRENFDFVDILYAGIQWAKLTDGPNDVDPSNPCGLTVAVQRTTVSETDDLRPKQEACDGDLTILPYDTSDNAALAVLMGRADALSADSPVSAWAVNRSDGRMSMVGEMFDAAPYGFAVPKDSDLGPAVAAALQHLIDTGAYAEILNKWGVDEGLVEHAMINERPIND
ncbi:MULTISPECIES: ABC transporter substrate-binding protein [Corynebacterium]|uniref:ABC transporter substrate-binding protein n=2 Tax=Corynebacteriaceae TaxID=1653 RepID=UPI000666A1A0|nr:MULTISPECIES: ABC transporter substrate-binding protein [Corynebacterium]OFK65108.1 ABC transporter substrate-binding protein [Corynebacterium sp. HMSC074A09]OFK68493.1 ABC transporter substrate-binding protein [Corynebacterium sp. HMSC076G08]OFN36161.1 ABC transporter substrate-binding protein [Corynebacterium sp. HMSC072A04]OFN77510.1 ABC transporter substrate-binding protein [Corynebacterium sp. HMSC070E08]OFO18870.1 ABC transporter substrate-binding protein [Corynebacterium sp. HMSC056F